MKELFQQKYDPLVETLKTETDEMELMIIKNRNCLKIQWLKLQNIELLEKEWFQSIIRYDCNIFNNCGFSYYYSSFKDAINEDNKILISTYQQNIAGYCLNDTERAICNCTNRFFIGNSCTESCPGLIGPILNRNGNNNNNNNEDKEDIDIESIVEIQHNEYKFYVCTGHGTCSISKILCFCQNGYFGVGCDECAPGYYNIQFAHNDSDIHCIHCINENDNSYHCPGGKTINIIVSFNHWIIVRDYSIGHENIFGDNIDDNITIISSICPSKYCCRDNNKCDYNDTTTLCAKNRDANSPLCGNCIDGYSEVYASNTCQKCNNNFFLIFVLMLMAFLYFLILGYDGFNCICKKSNKSKDSIDLLQEENIESIYNITETDIEDDEYLLERQPETELVKLNLIKKLINHKTIDLSDIE
eukprot:489918_1